MNNIVSNHSAPVLNTIPMHSVWVEVTTVLVNPHDERTGLRVYSKLGNKFLKVSVVSHQPCPVSCRYCLNLTFFSASV